MKSTLSKDPDNQIEVIDEHSHGRIRIRERQGSAWIDVKKCSIALAPDQLEEHARECLALATKLRNRP